MALVPARIGFGGVRGSSAGLRGAPDPSDGRRILMTLTPKCLKWVQQGRAARQDWLTTTISRKLSAHEQEKLQAALELLDRLARD